MEQVIADGSVMTIIHYVTRVAPQTIDPNAESVDGFRIACMPHMVEFHSTEYHPNYQRTDDIRAVTCPACIRAISGTVNKGH